MRLASVCVHKHFNYGIFDDFGFKWHYENKNFSDILLTDWLNLNVLNN